MKSTMLVLACGSLAAFAGELKVLSVQDATTVAPSDAYSNQTEWTVVTFQGPFPMETGGWKEVYFAGNRVCLTAARKDAVWCVVPRLKTPANEMLGSLGLPVGEAERRVGTYP